MKRVNTSSRAMRNRNGKVDSKGDSKYARKVKAGNQMYGPGCAATINAKRRAN